MAAEKIGSRRKAGSVVVDMDFTLTGLTFDSFPGSFRFYSKMTNEVRKFK